MSPLELVGLVEPRLKGVYSKEVETLVYCKEARELMAELYNLAFANGVALHDRYKSPRNGMICVYKGTAVFQWRGHWVRAEGTGATGNAHWAKSGDVDFSLTTAPGIKD